MNYTSPVQYLVLILFTLSAGGLFVWLLFGNWVDEKAFKQDRYTFKRPTPKHATDFKTLI